VPLRTHNPLAAGAILIIMVVVRQLYPRHCDVAANRTASGRFGSKTLAGRSPRLKMVLSVGHGAQIAGLRQKPEPWRSARAEVQTVRSSAGPAPPDEDRAG
jgi:hypothetical protein